MEKSRGDGRMGKGGEDYEEEEEDEDEEEEEDVTLEMIRKIFIKKTKFCSVDRKPPSW